MKVVIIGAGISGLSVCQLLKDKFEINILEKEQKVGGIARTKTIQDIAYHIVGGHCFNSKNPDVMRFVFQRILPKNEWHEIQRVAKIYYKNHFINYPIEFSLKDIAKFDFDIAYKMIEDLFAARENNPKNLEEWFKEKFGKTLAKEYFIPYNKKIWGMEPIQMSYLWVKDKLPVPNKQDVFKALIENHKDSMPHTSFYYPNSNNQNTFINALARELKIFLNYQVESIEKVNGKWIINGEKTYDLVISTAPLNRIPFVIRETPNKIKNEASKLRYNCVTNMLWETENLDSTWIYYPSSDTIFHRHINIGNFFKPKKNYTITESIGRRSFDEMQDAGKKVAYLKKPIFYNVSDYAYVVYDQFYRQATHIIKEYLENIGLHTLGRFGEWEYYNMDVCIESAMRLADKLKKRI